MKTRLLGIIVFSVILLALGTMFTPEVFGWCLENEDWPDAPCHAVAYQNNLWDDKLDWGPYYDYKGVVFMEQKRLEMLDAIKNNQVDEWLVSGPIDQNHNVYAYYEAYAEPEVDDEIFSLCAEKFDEIYQEYLNRDTSCGDPDGKVQCEPVGLEAFLRYDEEFTELECPLYIKDWAYLTENNDLAWQSIAPHYTFKMEKTNTEKTIPIIVSKYGFNSCDDFTIYIISHDEKREQVYTHNYHNICAIEPYEKKFQRFTFDLTILKESFKLQKGNYVIYLFHEPVSQFHFTENHEDPPDYQEELIKFYFSSHYMYDIISTSERQNTSGNSIDRTSYPTFGHEILCEPGLVLVNGTCSTVITEKPTGDDAPFFGIFVYLDNLISWIMGK